MTHGTAYRYRMGCKCDTCRGANAAAAKRRRARRREGVVVELRPYLHGERRTYTVQGCRCDDCKRAEKVYRNQWRARRAS